MTKRAEGAHPPKPRGFYPTPKVAFSPLAPYLPRGARVVEPMAGDGSLCQHLYDNGQEIVGATDIEPQHGDVVQMDVFDYTIAMIGDGVDYFVSNPPWPEPRKNGQPTLDIVNHLRLIKPSWMLLPSDFMFNVYAREIMGYCGGLIAVGRVKWIEDTKDEGYDNCAWYLFGRAPNGGKLHFIPRQSAAEKA